MRTTPVGIVMLNDEREHVWRQNNPENTAVIQRWTDVIRKNLKNLDGSSPEVIVGSEIITSVRVAQRIGEELSRANCKSIIMCYNVWDFPFLAWPFINSIGKNKPILSLSSNNGKYPGNVGLLATDGALRQVGIRTHRIVGEVDDLQTQSKVLDWIRAAQAITTMQKRYMDYMVDTLWAWRLDFSILFRQ